jgi:hypothetical protein
MPLALSNRIRLARDISALVHQPLSIILNLEWLFDSQLTAKLKLELIKATLRIFLEAHSYMQLCLLDGSLLVRAIPSSSKAFAPRRDFSLPQRRSER